MIDIKNPIKDFSLSNVIPLQNLFSQSSNNLFKSNSLNKFNYGGCSLMVECGPVAPETGVRFTPTAFDLKIEQNKKEKSEVKAIWQLKQ